MEEKGGVVTGLKHKLSTMSAAVIPSDALTEALPKRLKP
jgi:hypothetical protein